MPGEGGDERQVTELSGKYGNLGFCTTDGQQLYFVWHENTIDLWVMDVEWD